MPQNSDNDDGDQSVPAAIKPGANPDPIDPDITDPVIDEPEVTPDPEEHIPDPDDPTKISNPDAGI